MAHHLVHVLRLRDGAFTAFDPGTGDEAEAVLVFREGEHGEHGEQVVAVAGPVRANVRRPLVSVTLVQGIAKADKCDAIVRDATELGASEIVLVPTLRSIVKLSGEKRDARVLRWARIAEESARQCRRATPPVVRFEESWKQALLSVPEATARFCLYEESRSPLGPDLAPALLTLSAFAFAVGPEGGLDPKEVLLAEEIGWKVASIGPIILRTETVAAAVLGAVTIFTARS